MAVDVKQAKAVLQRELAALQQAGEELHLKAALARLDFKSELAHLEGKLRRAHEDIQRIGEHVRVPLRELEASVQTLLAEVRVGFARLRRTFEEPN